MADRQKEARIYRPSKSAMTSGRRNTRKWVLEYESNARKTPDPLMGWAGSADTTRQIRLRFDTKDEAIAYAEKHGIPYYVLPEHTRRRVVKSYADNFKPQSAA